MKQSMILVVFFAVFTPGPAWGDGAVYGMTNAIGDNEVVLWERASTGQLTFKNAYHTGGGGSGIQLDPTDSLGSQGSIKLTANRKTLFAVNTETGASNTQDCNTGSISSFAVDRDGFLTLMGKALSGGLFPSSLTVRGDVLYVLNSGGPGTCGTMPNITGFRITPNGQLSPIAG